MKRIKIISVFLFLFFISVYSFSAISNVKVSSIQDISAAITWLTSDATTGNKIYYRQLGQINWIELAESETIGAQYVHWVRIERDSPNHLLPNTTYEYKVESNGVQSNISTFTTLQAIDPTAFPQMVTAYVYNNGVPAVNTVVFGKIKKVGSQNFENYEISTRVTNSNGSYLFDVADFKRYKGITINNGDTLFTFGQLGPYTSGMDTIIISGFSTVHSTPMNLTTITFPSLINGSSLDSNNDGKVDKIELNFDRVLDNTKIPSNSAFTITTTTKLTISVQSINISGAKVILNLNTDDFYTGRLKVSYDTLAAGANMLVDMAGLPVWNFSNYLLTDNAPVRVTDIKLIDRYNETTETDYAQITFSENINDDVLLDTNRYQFIRNSQVIPIQSILKLSSKSVKIYFASGALQYNTTVNVIITGIVDPSGNAFPEYNQNINVLSNDQIAPVLTLTSSIPDTLNGTNQLSIAGTFVEQSGIMKMEYRIVNFTKEKEWIEFTTFNNNTQTWTLNLVLPDGRDYVYIRATDYIGNVSSFLSFNLFVNNNPPEISNATYNIVSDTLKVSFNVTDVVAIDYNTLPTVSLKNAANNSSYSLTKRIYANGVWQGYALYSNIPDGIYNLSVEGLRDSLGIIGNRNIPSFITKDVTAPEITNLNVANGQLFSVNQITFTGVVTDNLVGINSVSYQLDTNNWVNIAEPYAPFSFTLQGVASGSHLIKIKAVDNNNNTRIVEINFTVDLTAPVITISAPDIINNNTITISGTITETNKTGIAVVKYQLDTNTWVTLTQGFTNTSYSFTLNNITEGNHTVKVQAIDLVGHESNIAEKTFLADFTIPIVDITTSNSIINQLPITITGTLFDGKKGKNIQNVQYSLNNGAWQNITNFTQTEFSFSLSTLTANTTTKVKVKAIDTAGNVSNIDSINVVYDTTNPTVINSSYKAVQTADATGWRINISVKLSDNLSGIDFTAIPTVTIQAGNGNPLLATIDKYGADSLKAHVYISGSLPANTIISTTILNITDLAGNINLTSNLVTTLVGINTDSNNNVLLRNYPNPFNPNTNIEYVLNENCKVKLSIYDINGKLVRTLVNSEKAAGVHNIIWDGRDDNFNRVAAGLYFYELEYSGKKIINKMVLIK